MQKLAAVEEAKTLFEEAKNWGVWQWLTSKRKAREAADAAWEALAGYEKKVRDSWTPDVRKAWRSRNGETPPEIRRLKDADRHAEEAHQAAEAQFDEADRHMSAAMARDGCQMAIDAWTMREKLIRRMEALGRKPAS